MDRVSSYYKYVKEWKGYMFKGFKEYMALVWGKNRKSQESNGNYAKELSTNSRVEK